MQAYLSRAGRLPLALTFVFLGACADDTTAPTFSVPLRPNAAAGDVYLVTTPNDDGAIGSLRWALKFSTGGETIRFDPSLAGQTIFVDSTIYINEPVTIEGPAGEGVTISGRGTVRMFHGNYDGTLTLRNLTVTGGYSDGTVGPVLLTDGDLVAENSTFSGNHGPAGTVIYAGNITMTNSTVSDNIATSIAAAQQYGAVQGTTILLVNSTVANNGDAGVVAGTGRITLRNSIVAGHPRDNCHRYLTTGVIEREGTNISDDDKCGGPGEIIIADPKLAPLADNGGPTMTRALLAGSPAINAGTGCSVSMDQRYFPRDAQCDIGPFEFADFTTVTITIDPTTIVKNSTGWAVLTGTVTCSRDETFELALELAQTQNKKKGGGEVHSAATVPVQCTTTPRMWSGSMALTAGEFQAGAATAKAFTLNAEKWVAPAQASREVKLFRSK